MSSTSPPNNFSFRSCLSCPAIKENHVDGFLYMSYSSHESEIETDHKIQAGKSCLFSSNGFQNCNAHSQTTNQYQIIPSEYLFTNQTETKLEINKLLVRYFFFLQKFSLSSQITSFTDRRDLKEQNSPLVINNIIHYDTRLISFHSKKHILSYFQIKPTNQINK